MNVSVNSFKATQKELVYLMKETKSMLTFLWNEISKKYSIDLLINFCNIVKSIKIVFLL